MSKKPGDRNSKMSIHIRNEIKKVFSKETPVAYWNSNVIKIDWDRAIKQATNYFYKEKSIESAKLLTKVQDFYKRDDVDGYLDLLDNNRYLVEG